MASQPIVIWFRHDLRLRDHSAIAAAVRTKTPILFTYIYDDKKPWTYGQASLWWLHHSLKELQKDLVQKNAHLILRRGDPAEILWELTQQVGAKAVYCSRQYEPYEVKLEQDLHGSLSKIGVTLNDFRAICFWSLDMFIRKVVHLLKFIRRFGATARRS